MMAQRFTSDELEAIQEENPHLQGLSPAQLREAVEDAQATQEQLLGAPPSEDEG